jgi:hypothetical protein
MPTAPLHDPLLNKGALDAARRCRSSSNRVEAAGGDANRHLV